jgi:hypothetical protein
MRKQGNWPIKEREEWSTGLADGHRSSPLLMGWQVKPID